jgi:hypothetical protein
MIFLWQKIAISRTHVHAAQFSRAGFTGEQMFPGQRAPESAKSGRIE